MRSLMPASSETRGLSAAITCEEKKTAGKHAQALFRTVDRNVVSTLENLFALPRLSLGRRLINPDNRLYLVVHGDVRDMITGTKPSRGHPAGQVKVAET